MLNRKYTLVAVFIIVFAFYSISNFSAKNNEKRIYSISETEQEEIDKVKRYFEFDIDDYYLVHMKTIEDDIRYIYRKDKAVRKEVEDLYYNIDGYLEESNDTLVFMNKVIKEIKLIYIRDEDVIVVTSTEIQGVWQRNEKKYKYN